jgi:hypothetical protein
MDTTATNWVLDHLLFRNNSANVAIQLTTANCGPGQIIAPRFTSTVTAGQISVAASATNNTVEILDPIGYIATPANGTIRNMNPGVLFANLGAPANGSMVYCPDGQTTNPVVGTGTGCIAKRLNGVWVGN